MNTHVVIMAGGIGSRFWPLSTPEFPKQFIDILGCGRTLIQLTADRFRGICPESNFWVVTNAGYVDLVKSQLPGIPESHILAEPCARNTAPCIAWASWRIKAEDPSANIVVTPSDAVVMNPEEFRRAMAEALDFTASSDGIVTIGIRPTRPETGYGYVEVSARPDGSGGVFPVASFREKPDSATAARYLKDGNYLWNAGIFVWNVITIENAVRCFKPGLASDMDRIMESGDVAGIFPSCEKISIDYAVMEPASARGKVFTRPAEFGWSDLGNWASLYDKLTPDAAGNVKVGNVRFVECTGCIAHAEDSEKVVLQGLENCIVSVKGGRTLVCRRDQEQRIKDFTTE